LYIKFDAIRRVHNNFVIQFFTCID